MQVGNVKYEVKEEKKVMLVGNVKENVSHAIDANKPIVPVLYKKCDIPLQLQHIHPFLIFGSVGH